MAVQVTDGKDEDGNADIAVDDTIALIITVTDINEPPEFGSSAVELEVDENIGDEHELRRSDRWPPTLNQTR